MDRKEIGGYWWPASDTQCAPAVLREVGNIAHWLKFVPTRGVCVQAGANCGVYPAELAKHFDKVYTVEPDLENWACFQLNCTAPNVVAQRAAFGDKPGMVHVEHSEGNVGAHYVQPDGDIPMITIDGLGLEACDLIALDVEGAEIIALMGAQETVEKFRPVIIAEEKGHCRRFGQSESLLHKWMAARGYRGKTFIGRDRVWLP